MDRLALLPKPKRRNIAADLASAMKTLTGNTEPDHLHCCYRALQDERWRLVSSGVNDIAEERFARVIVVEQWIRAQIDLLYSASPVKEILAERRCRAIEHFVRENFVPKMGEVVQLRSWALTASTDRGEASKTAA